MWMVVPFVIIIHFKEGEKNGNGAPGDSGTHWSMMQGLSRAHTLATLWTQDIVSGLTQVSPAPLSDTVSDTVAAQV